jgi:ribonuclease HII
VTLDLRSLRVRYLDGARPLPREIESALREDGRLEAARLLRRLNDRRRANRAEGQRLRRMLRFEQRWWAQGIERVAGIDEAGMSPLAGPVVAAAVILPVGLRLRDVDDSKKLDPEMRARLAPIIRESAIAWAVGVVDVPEIDRLNIYHAGLLAMQRAFDGLGVAPQALLIDARRLRDVALPQEPIVGGDGKSLSIAAASILAKTTRDAIMCELDARYPGYGFAQHKGYGVREHRRALERLGCCPEHRRSFGPVKAILETGRTG